MQFRRKNSHAPDTRRSRSRSIPRGTRKIERERKFLVEQRPRNLHRLPRESIEQGYLAIEPSGDEVRIRRTGAEYRLTVKRGHGTSRLEVEVPIAAEHARKLWALTRGRRISKVRYRIPHAADLTIELDVYRGFARGLLTAEVEFPSDRALRRFTPPDWFGREVTGDPDYSNSRLAMVQSKPAARRE